MLVLKELSDTFPVGKVVLSDNHNISYFNEFGGKFIHGLTGSQNINFFKHFFLNEILIGRDGIKENKPFSIEIDGFWLNIIPYDDIISEKKEKIKYIIFIVKNTMYEEKKIKIDFDRILTTREKEVCNLIRMGYSNKEIEIALKISISTVKVHIQKIFEKCGAKNRIHLINCI